jgi:hypothetical protein
MTAPTEPTLNYGLRFARLYALNTSGTPAAANTTPYEGLQIKGSTAFELTVPEPRKITGNGEDGVTQVVYLPPLEGTSGTLTQEATDPNVASFLDDTTVRTLGEATLMGGATNKQGFEPQVALILTQAARGLTTGKNYWHSYFLPSAQVVKMPGGMTADKANTRYSIAPNVVSAHLWGEPFVEGTDGYLSAQFVETWTNNRPVVTSFVGTGTEDEFTFPVATPSASTYATSTIVFVNGTKVPDADVTITATKITFDGGKEPALNARVDVFRELT